MSKRLNLHLFLLDYGHFKHKDIFWFEPVKVMASSFGNLDRFFCHIKRVFIAKNSEEYNYIYKTGGLKTGSIKKFAIGHKFKILNKPVKSQIWRN